LEAARDQFRRIASQSTQAIDEAKEISFNLRPYLLDRLGLTKALESMIQKVDEGSDVRFTVDVAELDGFFAPDEQISVYRIIQESLHNSDKHAGARAAAARGTRGAAAVEMTIRDDGRGVVDARDPDGEPHSGFGLIGIRERARLLGATPIIESASGRGTTITIRFLRPESC